jgi:uncharacterized sulfatase
MMLVVMAHCLSAFNTCKAAADDPAPAKRPPNIVFFLVDDMGWTDPHCYGNDFHETPNIDRLAAEGMRFTNAYAACPVCSPTRASIMTGKYPATLNLTDFIPGHWRPWEKLVVPKMNLQLPLNEVTFAEELKRAGYVSGAFGKWHLGGRANYPAAQGFDEFIVTGGRHFAPNFRFTAEPPLEKTQRPGKNEYLGDFLTRRAERFLSDHRDAPFVLYLSHYAVHIPLEAQQRLIAKYEKKTPKPKDRVNNPIYAAMVEHVDRSLGRIVQKLDELNLADNTILIFFSDNGGLYKRFDGKGTVVMSNTPLREEKGTLYEGGIREPLIVRWPGVVEPGSLCDEPVTSVDFFPTMVEIAGLQSRAQHRVDGVSLLPLFRQTGRLNRRAIYWHYPHYHHTTPAGAVRAGDFKLIEYFDDGRVELYNLRDDIGETTNLAKNMPRKAQQLRNMLAAWRKSVGARMPTKNPDYDPQQAHLWKRRPRPSSK